MEKKECMECLTDLVDVGTKHLFLDRPFFLKGIVLEITDQYLKLKLSDGYKIIPLEDIIEIRRLK